MVSDDYVTPIQVWTKLVDAEDNSRALQLSNGVATFGFIERSADISNNLLGLI